MSHSLGHLSYLLAWVTCLNTLIWFIEPSHTTLSFGIPMCLYGGWLLIFWRNVGGRPRPADWSTFLRLFAFYGLIVYILANPGPAWNLVVPMSFILALDGVDGWIARRWQQPSSYGAILDMEVDHMITTLLVAISVLIMGVGPWFLLVNFLRPAYLILSPQKPASADESKNARAMMRAKTICVISIILLITNLAPLLTIDQKNGLSALNLFLLILSFGLDSYTELQNRTQTRIR
jgi:phosphatidylglycerophosphate synthase